MAEESFESLIARVREGDQDAADEIVRRYEDQVRRVVRAGLRDPRVCNLYESGDIAQSVMALFFEGARKGDFDLSKPENLSKLLLTMAKNRLIDKVRQQDAAKRPKARSLEVSPDVRIDPPSPDASPSRQAMGRELLEEFRKRLSEEERWLVDQRALGRAWDDIGAELGQTPDGVRMKLKRAVDRVTREVDPSSRG